MKRACRPIAVLLLAGLVGVGSPAGACDRRDPTPDTGPGPHDFSYGAGDNKLWREGDGGEPLFFRARVLDTCGQPITGARVRVLHANQYGAHEADRWRAHLDTDAAGTFQLITVFPGYTGGIPRHMHFIITHPGYPTLTTRLFFRNDPSIGEELEDLAMVLDEVKRGDNRGWMAGYEFILQPN
jgi:protocatechuate 3,4-dioxygenase beta subunit